ncbi:MAG: T9SS type A sorting domain-containing protein, partial [Bacteroidetes bacterium]|nr:T9SS type A sorting domain-containing protein [Bacteroidota bacterium]
SWSTAPVQSTKTASGLSAGTYMITVTDNKGCTMDNTVTITEPTAITLATSSGDATCGSANGSASVTATGGTPGYTYSWNTVPVKTTATATGLIAKNYTVTVTDSKGCTKASNVTVGNANGFTATTSSTNITCNGANDGTATVSASGGTSPYAYSWNTSPSQTTATVTGLSAGTYIVTASDAGGCSFPVSVFITEPAVLSVTVNNTDVGCNGASTGDASTSVSGGTSPYSYLWDSGETTATVNNLSAGTYTVTVTDSKNCVTTKTTTINEPAALTVSFNPSTNVSCNGASDGIAKASVSGGSAPYAYSWSTAPVQSTKTASGLSGGTYTVTVTDNNGCTSDNTVTITEPSAIVLSTGSVDASCNNSNGSASVTASGGGGGPYTYVWSSNPVQSTATATGLSANTYTVAVTDNNGCSIDAMVIVGNTGAGTPSVTSTDVTCNGGNDGTATVSITGGSSPFTYLWNTSPAQTTATATGLSAGTYTIKVTETGGCISIVNVTINEPAALMVSTSKTDATCPGCSDGTATALVSGGSGPYTYAWSPGGGTGATETGLSANIYTVCVTDMNGCTACSSVTVNEPPLGISGNTIPFGLAIHPNPSSGEFIISLDVKQVQDITIVISNVLGQVIYSEKQNQIVGSFNKTIDLSGYDKGMYQLKIIGKDKSNSRKIVLQ